MCFVTVSDGHLSLSPRQPCMAVAAGPTLSPVQHAKQWPAVHQVNATSGTFIVIIVVLQALGNISLRPC